MMADGSTSYDQPDVPHVGGGPQGARGAARGRLAGDRRRRVDGPVRVDAGRLLLVQHVELEQYGQRIGGIEVVGRLRPFGEPPSQAIHSRFYDSTGNTLDYVYELDGDTLTIWAGKKGSPAYYQGTFSPDGNSQTGAWIYPGGGGYQATATRIEG
jgi:hypothetical protein